TASAALAGKALAPTWLATVHGDLTFENILYLDGDVRVIDMDGADFLDAAELDLGKMFQSLLGRYEEWAHRDGAVCEVHEGDRFEPFRVSSPDEELLRCCLGHWARVFQCSADQVRLKGKFYMGLHFIRMVPFRMRVSEEQALCALVMAIQWIGDALGELK
ncbi:MAG: hypothetical protein N2C14_20025, partial [Planctomycetales bacterium]